LEQQQFLIFVIGAWLEFWYNLVTCLYTCEKIYAGYTHKG
jgi:hypothetical protein